MKKILSCVLLFIVLIFLTSACLRPALGPGQEGAGRSSTENTLLIGIMIVGILLLIPEILVVYKANKGWDTRSVRMVGLTLVMIFSVLLIAAGYAQEQMAPVFALLGSITGYLIGKRDPKDSD